MKGIYREIDCIRWEEEMGTEGEELLQGNLISSFVSQMFI